MATLTSASTLAEVKAAYIDNASFEEDGSVSAAKTFVTACRILLLQLPKEAAKGGESLTLSIEQIHAEMKRAQVWVNANGGNGPAGGVLHTSFENFRD